MAHGPLAVSSLIWKIWSCGCGAGPVGQRVRCVGPPGCWQGEEAGAVLWLGKERSAVCRMTLVTMALPGVMAGPSAEPNSEGSDVRVLPG
jgi:hypothetical protein